MTQCNGALRFPDSSYIRCHLRWDHEENHISDSIRWFNDGTGHFWLEEVSRDTFEGGGHRDNQEGKPRFDLLVPRGVPFEEQFVTRIARLLANGAERYGDRNWEEFSTQDAVDRAKSSAFRHFMQWMTGERDEDHAAAVVFNLMAAENADAKRKP